MADTINIALVGYGYWGKIWEKVLTRQSCFDFRYIYTPRLLPQGKHTNSLEKLTDSTIDALIICTPVHTHHALTQFFLEHEKHILCEKPLTLCSKQASHLGKLAMEKGLVLESNYTYLHSPTIQKMKAELSSLGEIHAMETQIDGFGNFYLDQDVYSVHCPHVIALTLDLFPDKIFEVSTDDLVFSRQGTVDVGIIKMRSKNLIVHHHSSLRGIKKERKIVIYGSQGVMEYDATSEEQYKVKYYTENGHQLIEKTSAQAHFDETKNINLSLEKFYRAITKQEKANIDLSIRVSSVLEQLTSKIRRN